MDLENIQSTQHLLENLELYILLLKSCFVPLTATRKLFTGAAKMALLRYFLGALTISLERRSAFSL